MYKMSQEGLLENLTLKKMKSMLKFSKSQSYYKVGTRVKAINRMDRGKYTYTLTKRVGEMDFKPHFTPKEMMDLGVFEGKYMNDCMLEFPREWFEYGIKHDKFSPEYPNVKCNYFGIKSRQSLSHWIEKGWIKVNDEDPDNRGWFQWYCRYYLGRRIPSVDKIQISRWKSFKRHFEQVKKNCKNVNCRPKQRQALLQWSYNPFI